MRVKMSKPPPPAPTASAIGPCPTVIKIVGRPGTESLPSTIAPPDHPLVARSVIYLIIGHIRLICESALNEYKEAVKYCRHIVNFPTYFFGERKPNLSKIGFRTRKFISYCSHFVSRTPYCGVYYKKCGLTSKFLLCNKI